MATRCSGWR
jgi:hypothetical protein